MKKIMLIPLFLAGSAAAQIVQNSDISILAGGTAFGSHVVPGSNVTVDGGVALCTSFLYGYQLARASAASFWLEYAQSFKLGDTSGGSIAGGLNNEFTIYTLGGRVMIPVKPRVSLYGALGGGVGSFYYPAIDVSKPLIKSNYVWHGVFEFGGGVDLRLSQRFSIRTEVRDFVTGKGLSGASGRHHILPLLGVSFHF
jgi:hypothetical protein